MITEDYVSFETAKLLKEKGFNERTIYGYIENKGIVTDCCYCNIPGFPSDYDYNNTKTMGHHIYAKPTLQMAMKWLREEYRLFVNIELLSGIKYTWSIWFMNESKEEESSLVYDTYEQACESAIRYCLENLI